MIPSEAAHDTVAALGEIGMLQFRDLNTEKSAFQRTYANQVTLSSLLSLIDLETLMEACSEQVKRSDEMARKLRYLKEQVN